MSQTQVFIFAGQSNMSAYPPTVNLLNSGLITQPGHPGSSPDFVATSDQTAANEWTGHAAASIDSGVQYPYPSLADYPCLYSENTRGDTSGVQDGWGTYVKQFYNNLGVLGVGTSFGPELSFLYKYLQGNPGVPVAGLKTALGGTSLRGDWLPPTIQLGVAQAGSASSITLASSDFGTSAAYVGLRILITAGTGVGSYGDITAYNSTTKVATVAWSGAAPATGSGYGIERLQMRLLRTQIELAIARFVAAGTSYQFAAFHWWQGESGAHSAGTAADDSQYQSDLRGLIAYLRTITGRADLPILIYRISDNWGWETTPNPYLVAAGYPYAALEASYQSNQGGAVDGRISTIPTGTRDSYLAGAVARRASQAVVAADAHCAMVNTDGCPVRPPYDLTAAENDLYAYHLGGPGVLAVGERVYAKGAAAFGWGRHVRVSVSGRRLKVRAA